MSINSFYNTHIYGQCAILNYDFKETSTISSDIYYNTLSAPIYTTISSVITYSISSLIYSTISDSFENTISSTVYKFDLSGNKYPEVTWYNYAGSTNKLTTDGMWHDYERVSYEKVISGYVYQDLYYKQVYEKSSFYVEGNAKIEGNLIVCDDIITMSGSLYGLTISGNLLIRPNYNIQCDHITSGQSGNLYFGCDDNTQNFIYVQMPIFI